MTEDISGGDANSTDKLSRNANKTSVLDGSNDINWGIIQSELDNGDKPEGELIGLMAQGLNQKHGFLARRDDKELFAYYSGEGVYKPDGDTFVAERLFEGLQWRNYEDRYQRKASTMLSLNNFVDSDQIGNVEGKLCLENGVLDISEPDNPKLGKHSVSYPFTSKFPVEHQQETECPQFKDYLEEVVPNDEERKKLQEYSGYCLHTWNQSFKKAILLIGPTDSGKSTFLRIMEALIGKDNISHETLRDLCNEDSRWASAKLSEGVVNVRNEMTTSKLKQMERFKEIVGGGDTMSGEYKGQDKFDFTPTQKFLFATNEVPKVDGDGAFFNRWLHVRFPNSIPTEEQNQELVDTIISEELSGVLNWALEGYSRLMNQGRFTFERDTEEKRSMWSEYGDSISQFIEDKVIQDSSAKIPEKEVKNAYQSMCDQKDMPSEVDQTLTKRLKSDCNVTQVSRGPKGNQTKYYKGLTLEGHESEDSEEKSHRSPFDSIEEVKEQQI